MDPAQEDRLSGAIKQLSSENAVLNARLLACYDQLDVARYRDQSTRELEQANAALVLLNQNLALRLRESQADGGRLRERLSAVDEPGT